MFVRHDFDEIRVWIEGPFTAPTKLQIRRRPWPIGPIEVTGTSSAEFSLSGDSGGGESSSPTSHGAATAEADTAAGTEGMGFLRQEAVWLPGQLHPPGRHKATSLTADAPEPTRRARAVL